MPLRNKALDAGDSVAACPLDRGQTKLRNVGRIGTRKGVIMPTPREPNEKEPLHSLLARVPALAGRRLTIEPLGGGCAGMISGADSTRAVLFERSSCSSTSAFRLRSLSM